MDEPILIKQAQRGDVTAYNTLVLHYQDVVYRVAYRIIGEPGAAADASQEAFINAYKGLRRYRGGSFKAWLLRIVTNAAYDELRRRQRRPEASLDEISEVNESSPLLVAESRYAPDELADQRELVQAIERCLEQLPEDQRTAAVLSDVEGYDYHAIADIMGSSLGTVKSRLSRARAKLRDCLQFAGELIPAGYRL
jgi:RNA polymerase sigma-70 factor (ECF subfamily)